MTRASRRRLVGWGLGALVAAVLGPLVGWVPAERFTVERPDGSPAAGAVVAFHYRGHRFNFVDSLTYERSGGLVRADEEGRIEIPGLLYRKAPLDEYLAPWIDLLFDASTHCAVRVGPRQPGLAGPLAVRAGGRGVVLADCGADPNAWERSLEELYSLLAYDIVYAGNASNPRIESSPQEVRALEEELAADYGAFIARYGTTPRQPPANDPYLASLPDAEREATLARIQADLARTPFWGGYMEPRWPERLDRLRQAIPAAPPAD